MTLNDEKNFISPHVSEIIVNSSHFVLVPTTPGGADVVGRRLVGSFAAPPVDKYATWYEVPIVA